MRRICFVILLLLMARPVHAAMTYGRTFYRQNRIQIGKATPADPLDQFINEVETTFDGTSGVASWIFTPGTEPSSPSEGQVYYDSAGNNLKLYTGAAFVDIDLSGASSLGTAYTAGSKILAPTLEVEIEVADSSNNPALRLDFDDATTNAQDVLVIDNAGDDAAAVSIQINGTAGYDIQGTSDTWQVSIAGVAGLVGATIDNSDLVFTEPTTNDVTLLADGDGILTISAGSMEDIDLNLATSNTLTMTSSTGVVTVDWGALDAHTGLNALAFDGAVANTITQTGTGGTDDLTISQATSGQDASLILQSSGTGTDALSLISSVADIKANSADNIDIDAADNITVDTADGSYTLTIAGSTNGDYTATVADVFSLVVVDTLLLQNTEASKDITVNSVLGSVLIEAEEDAANAILITADGGTSSTLRLHNDTGTAATSIDLLSDVGGISAVASAGAIVLTATGATAGDITLTAGDDFVTIVTGTNTYGVDGTGFDSIWYGDTASSNMTWDQDGDTNGSLILTGASQTITGIDSGGNLLTVSGIDTTGNSDSVVIAHSGTGAAVQITSSEADTQLIELISAANQTTWLAVADGAAGNWIGADDVGMVHLKADTALAHAGASQLQVVNSAQPISAAEGFLARFVDTGTARTNAYAVEIEVTSTTGGLYSTGHATFEKGAQVLSQSVTATADGLTTGLIPDHASFVTVTSDNADKVVVLPTWVIGHVIRITVPATGCELETLAASNDTINTVDCDGTNQMAMAAASIYHLECVADSTWIAYAWGNDGAAEATIVPDAD